MAIMKASNRFGIVSALGTAQTIAWASSYYLPAVLATPMAASLGVSPVWVFAGFSAALVVSALVGPWAGARIDSLGGRGVLAASNVIFAAGLGLLATAQSVEMMFAGWIVIGLGMGAGLYESAFATLTGIYGADARSPITGITLIAGFASTVGWPLSALLEANHDWRMACLVWAGLHLLVALPLNAILPAGTLSAPARDAPIEKAAAAPSETRVMALLAFVFAVTWFCSTAMAAHLPRLLETAGATTAVAVAAGALIGPAQVVARVAEFGLLRKVHPLMSARIAAIGHPMAVATLMLIGAPAAYAFTLLHGAGNGILTIAKGTLPLALFGPAGYGFRQGLLNAPARIMQALAPLLFGYALERFGAQAVWLTGGLGFSALLALLLLHTKRTSPSS
ncbi:MAG: MFS transporter [Bosea sp. (in: a-proteobacteria)]